MNPEATDSFPQDRDAEWKRLNAALGGARKALLERLDDDGDRSAAQQVVEQLAPYWDAKRERAVFIQNFARNLSTEIHAFHSTRAGLIERAALLIVRAEQVCGSLGTAMLATGVDAVQRDPGARGNKVSDQLDEARRGLKELNDLGRAIGWELEWSLRIAASLISLREAELTQYLEEAPELDPSSLWAILSAAAAEEGAGKIAEEILIRGVGLAVPVANVAVGVVQAGRSIREKVKAMEAHYEPGALDRMFELAQ